MDLETACVGLEAALGYEFEQREWLERALTHGSYKNENETILADNQRLEFLGDAVLELIVSAAAFREYPEASEGRLTRLRAQLVNTRELANVARTISLGECLRLGRGEDNTGGRSRASVLADAFEAVIGAVFVDGGYDAAEDTVHRLFHERLAEAGMGSTKDPRSTLQEWVQRHFGTLPKYRVTSVTLDNGTPGYEASVTVLDADVSAQARAASKKGAQRLAASAALKALEPVAAEDR